MPFSPGYTPVSLHEEQWRFGFSQQIISWRFIAFKVDVCLQKSQ